MNSFYCWLFVLNHCNLILYSYSSQVKPEISWNWHANMSKPFSDFWISICGSLLNSAPISGMANFSLLCPRLDIATGPHHTFSQNPDKLSEQKFKGSYWEEKNPLPDLGTNKCGFYSCDSKLLKQHLIHVYSFKKLQATDLGGDLQTWKPLRVSQAGYGQKTKKRGKVANLCHAHIVEVN